MGKRAEATVLKSFGKLLGMNLMIYSVKQMETPDCSTQATGTLATGTLATGTLATGTLATGTQATGTLAAGTQATVTQATGTLATVTQATGHRNTGNCNTGDRNTGNRNTGDRNTGNCNTGDRNTGNWNTCNGSTGFFCTEEDRSVRIFNKPSGMSANEFRNSRYAYALYSSPFMLAQWIEYTESEKDTEEKKITGGYLKELTFKEACRLWWGKMSAENKAIVKQIPNFDADIFQEITGIDVRVEALIDGKND